MSSMMPPRTVGVWQECKLKKCKKMFFRYAFGDRCYGLSDKIGVCPMCIFEKKMENGTLKKAMRDIIINYHHKSIDSKPEKDSL